MPATGYSGYNEGDGHTAHAFGHVEQFEVFT
jgi:hypothetical protein